MVERNNKHSSEFGFKTYRTIYIFIISIRSMFNFKVTV